MLEDAGLKKWLKTTQMRKVGSTLCTAQGLSPQEVRTLSKHSTRQDNFIKSYGCEVSVPVASTIAGFRPKVDHYFIPRTTTHTLVDLLALAKNVLFIDFPRWMNEIAGLDGNESRGVRYFLEKMIPF